MRGVPRAHHCLMAHTWVTRREKAISPSWILLSLRLSTMCFRIISCKNTGPKNAMIASSHDLHFTVIVFLLRRTPIFHVAKIPSKVFLVVLAALRCWMATTTSAPNNSVHIFEVDVLFEGPA